MTRSEGPTGFLGLSHLGIVSGLGWVSFGQPVVAVDEDPEPVEQLRRGTLPVHEPGLPELLERHRGQVRFSTEFSLLSDCPLVIVSRDVPTGADNASDLAPVLDLVDRAIPHLRPGVVLAVMSQVPPGFTGALGERIRSRRRVLAFELYYWVETLVFGNAVERFLKPERLIVGCADPGLPIAPVFERGLARFACPILPMRYESAELTKTAINLYLASSVTYANTLADLCEAVGADWAEVVPALRLDPRIGPAAYLRPSLGVSGGHLERDLITLRRLAHERGLDAALIDTMVEYNTRRFGWVLRQLRRHVFSTVSAPTLAIWGLTYKKNTRSMKNSPALRLIRELAGQAEFRVWDPVIAPEEVEVAVQMVASRDAALKGADALLIMADWDDFATADVEAIRDSMRRPVVIDCVGVLEPRRRDLGGIQYISMGR